MTKKISINNNLSNFKSNHLNKSAKTSDDRKFIPKQYKNIAKSYEKQFAQFMVDQMNKTVQKNDPLSTADKYYQGLMDDQRTTKLTNNNGGLGLQKMILDQIYPKRMRNELTFNAFNNKNKINNVNGNPYSQIKMNQENKNE